SEGTLAPARLGVEDDRPPLRPSFRNRGSERVDEGGSTDEESWRRRWPVVKVAGASLDLDERRWLRRIRCHRVAGLLLRTPDEAAARVRRLGKQGQHGIGRRTVAPDFYRRRQPRNRIDQLDRREESLLRDYNGWVGSQAARIRMFYEQTCIACDVDDA